MLPFVDKTILVRLRTLCFSDIIEKNIWKERERWNASCPKGKKVELKIIRTIGIFMCKGETNETTCDRYTKRNNR